MPTGFDDELRKYNISKSKYNIYKSNKTKIIVVIIAISNYYVIIF